MTAYVTAGDESSSEQHEAKGTAAHALVTSRFLDDECLCFLLLGGSGHGECRRGFDGATLTGIMFGVKVDRDDPLPLHDQVAAEIRRAIAEGEAGPGERLPPAKDFAAVLGVTTNTVFRALRILRDEGLLEFQRGRGITVAGTPQRGAVIARTREFGWNSPADRATAGRS